LRVGKVRLERPAVAEYLPEPGFRRRRSSSMARARKRRLRRGAWCRSIAAPGCRLSWKRTHHNFELFRRSLAGEFKSAAVIANEMIAAHRAYPSR
jgi:hypothetical protein